LGPTRKKERKKEEIAGENPGIIDVPTKAKQVASSDVTLLILGETVAGKELLARAIHRLS